MRGRVPALSTCDFGRCGDIFVSSHTACGPRSRVSSVLHEALVQLVNPQERKVALLKDASLSCTIASSIEELQVSGYCGHNPKCERLQITTHPVLNTARERRIMEKLTTHFIQRNSY